VLEKYSTQVGVLRQIQHSALLRPTENVILHTLGEEQKSYVRLVFWGMVSDILYIQVRRDDSKAKIKYNLLSHLAKPKQRNNLKN